MSGDMKAVAAFIDDSEGIACHDGIWRTYNGNMLGRVIGSDWDLCGAILDAARKRGLRWHMGRGYQGEDAGHLNLVAVSFCPVDQEEGPVYSGPTPLAALVSAVEALHG